jgi:hypothetical protein
MEAARNGISTQKGALNATLQRSTAHIVQLIWSTKHELAPQATFELATLRLTA